MTKKINPRQPALRGKLTAAEPSTDLTGRLTLLLERAQQSENLFASPLGPFWHGGRSHFLPRFVYFGPDASGDPLRLAVLAGLGRHDAAASRALLAFLEGAVNGPGFGPGINLSVFPVLNLVGQLADEDRDLAGESWSQSRLPEIELARQDAQLRCYHVFVRLETSPDDEPTAWVRAILGTGARPTGVRIFTSEDFDSWPVRFETLTAGAVNGGPLTLADDLPQAPIEVTLALPSSWPQARMDRSVNRILRRLFASYHAFLAFGQHL